MKDANSKTVACHTCGEKMSIGVKSHRGFCWKCVHNGKAAEYFKNPDAPQKESSADEPRYLGQKH
jgi:hypothetical protein